MSIDGKSEPARDQHFVHYFTPKVRLSDRRRSSSGIPSPITRVYPDRKYKPVLVVSSKEIQPARVEVDEELSDEEDEGVVTRLTVAPSYGSSPLPQQISDLGQGETPRRSFSFGDKLATVPQQLWRRPSLSRGKSTGSKLIRRARPRVVSAPQAEMGSVFSKSTDGESDRPAKRRDLTDPATAQRSIYTSGSYTKSAWSPSVQEVDLDLGASTPHSTNAYPESLPSNGTPYEPTSTPPQPRRLPSATTYSTTVRQARVSAAQSEITSTVGSDSEYRSIGDASTDYQSDAIYDSYPTRTTRSSSGKRGPHIETIFDESPPHFSSGRSTKLKDLLNDGAFPLEEHAARYRHSTIEEEESITSTPVRSLHNKSVSSPPSGQSGPRQRFTSSPPIMSAMPDPDDIDWDAPDDEPSHDGFAAFQSPPANNGNGHLQSLPFRFGLALPDQQPSSTTTPFRPNGNMSDRANLFDWSETLPSPSQNDSPPRPRTVHGKKDQESRGSRAPGRRAPSGMHARSHSVPVVPDVEGKRSNVATSKFGTWGNGSKVVTEDWNEDFDFDELPPPIPEHFQHDEKRIDSGHEMFVPKSIREQQENVLSNIRQLREWRSIIEELKELRVRAITLQMMDGPYARDWEEVDAMIELADQESEEKTLEPRGSPPSSPGFDYDAFDEPMPNIAEASRPRGQSLGMGRSPPLEAAAAAGAEQRPITPQDFKGLRPRKDSEAVAKSVIEAIQSKRSVSEPTAQKPVPAGKKVPFDTRTLRHIVPYVKELTRKVKDGLRQTEGLYSSPHRSTSRERKSRHEAIDEPAFRSIFDSPRNDSTLARRRSRRDQAMTDHDGMDTDTRSRQADLASQMEDMRFDE